MEHSGTFETRKVSLGNTARPLECKGASVRSFHFEYDIASPRRPTPRDTASIASAISELRSRFPHLEPPRFPPVVRRVHSSLLGGQPKASASSEAEGKRCKARRCVDKHTLVTRDVVHERGVLALEVTKGRKRVYKKMQRSDKDNKAADGCPGSFDMVQVCAFL
jgi:hypothetical protein